MRVAKTSPPRTLTDLLFEKADVGLCLVAPDGTVVRANGEWLRWFGLGEEQVFGENIIELFPATRDTALAMHARARAGHRVEVPRHAQLVNGRETWWEGSIEPVPTEGGTGLLITACAVSAAEARQPSEAPEKRTRELAEISPEPQSRVEWQHAVITGIARIFEKALAVASEEDLGRACLAIAEEVTQSKFGFIGEINPRTGRLDDIAISDPGWDACRMVDAAGHGKRKVPVAFTIHGIYGRVLLDGRSVLTNDPPSHPDSIGTPLGHPPLRTFLGVPLVHAGATWGMLAVGNRGGGYGPAERDALEALAPAIVQAFMRTRDEKALRHSAEILELGDALCELDSEFRVVRVNAMQERLTGVPRAQSLGKTYWELWPETADPASPWWREYHRCMEERVPVEFENYYAPLGLWSNVTAYPTSSGGIAIFFRDVSRRMRAEEELRDSESFYRQMLESIPGMVFTTRPDGYCDYQSQQWVEYTGVPMTEHVGDGWNKLLHPDDRARAFAHWRAAVEGTAPYDLEYRVRRNDGEYKWFRVIGRPIRDEAGKIVRWFGVAMNIEEIKRTETALRDADRRKDEFLGMLSHELRNPLAPIRNSTYILRHAEPGSDQARRAQTVIERQTQHLTRLVDDLLDVTRIARGKIELQRELVDLRDVVRRTAEDLRSTIENRGLTFRVDVPAAHVWADLDVTRVAQAIGNLLHNAAKFTARGGSVTVSLHSDGTNAQIRVADSGTGIDAELLPRIFTAFVQGDRTLARSDGGLGLGLVLVKGIVELHGGTVTGASAGNGQGAEFTIQLPVAKRVVPEPRLAISRSPASSGRRVLVVDDNVDAAESLAETLKLAGHEVEVAFDGPSAVDMVRLNPPDVVLCDIGLPGMTGYEVARRLRASGVNGMQLIAVSGYAQPEDVMKAIEAGFDEHVAKPCDPEEINRLLS